MNRIDPRLARPPQGWNRWHRKEEFARALQQDGDSSGGLDRCLNLTLKGNKDSQTPFNLVIEDNPIPSRSTQLLQNSGFEAGVHSTALSTTGSFFRIRQNSLPRSERLGL